MASASSRKERLLLVTTCGISILTNAVAEDERGWIISHSNDASFEGTDRSRFDQVIVKARECLREADEAERCRLSAELNCIAACRKRWKVKEVQHILVHTDTALGRETAKMVAACLSEMGEVAQFLTSSDLRTDSASGFKLAMAEMTKKIEELDLETWREKGWFIAFNLTGGFKSVNAYLQALGMHYADRCVFLFEGASELIEIPTLPLRLDEVSSIEQHLDVFRRLSVGYSVSAAEVDAVPESLIFEHEGRATTSVWGDVIWARVRRELLGERLLEPLSPKVKVSAKLGQDFKKFESHRRAQANEAIDEFCAFRDGIKPLLKSRTFKTLEGKPVPPSTHQLYAWSDGDAGRLFGYFEDGVFVFDTLREHL